MDELVIEGETYISTKRAAKDTGYAKDYVGQLCREGRVSARLVGRSWYVLASAVREHRFGSGTQADQPVKKEPAPAEVKIESAVHAPPSLAWEPARYESIVDAPLPNINRLAMPYATAEPAVAPTGDPVPEEVHGESDMQSVWSEWFQQAHEPKSLAQEPHSYSAVDEAEEPEPLLQRSPAEHPDVPDSSTEDDAEVAIPLRVLPREPQEPVRESVPMSSRGELRALSEERPIAASEQDVRVETTPVGRRKRRIVHSIIAFVAVFFALISAAMAFLSSGHADSFVFSSRTVANMTGVFIYAPNK